MRHIPAVKRLLVVHKAWKFSLLHFLTAQHQHSGGGGESWDTRHPSDTSDRRPSELTRHRLVSVADKQLTVSGPQRTARACRLFPGRPPSAAATDLRVGRCGGWICGNVDVTAGIVSSSGINLQDKGVRPMGLRPSNIGTLEAAEVFDPFPESHRLGK